jgi:CheY-like chemotaxis protein
VLAGRDIEMALTVESSTSPRQPPIVLLVEDHEDTRQMYAEFLRAIFEVRQASDGQQALDVMHERPPDLLITDLSLPGIDGFELVAMVRTDPLLRKVPIICLSGYSGHVYEQRALAAGCDRMLQKPCMPDALAEAATELLRQPPDRSVPS